jgi:hypothetical protein
MADQGEHASQGFRKYFELTPDFNVAHKAPTNRWVNEKQQMKGFSFPSRSALPWLAAFRTAADRVRA